MPAQCVILAGGLGTRISEESHLRPKPMIEIGGRPMLWHVMKYYSSYGVRDFIICLGYRGYIVKEYFFNYYLHNSDVTIDVAANSAVYHDSRSEPWRITLVDTGDTTMTGGRLKRVTGFLTPDQPFFMTYGDGLADVDITAELAFHRAHGKLATMTIVRPPARFGSTALDGDRIIGFEEKPQASGGFINGGFFVLSPKALEFVDGDDTSWETTPMERLLGRDELRAWRHEGFWQPMDTLREKQQLEAIWESGRAPWKVW